MSSLSGFRTRGATIPQSEPLNDRQVKNNAGGFVFEISALDRIKRFLILGSEGSFYQAGAKLTEENARTLIGYVQSASEEEQLALLGIITSVSVQGRAPKQQPALFALAVVISHTRSDLVKNQGYLQVNSMCRTASTMFEFFGFLNQFQRFGMGARKAIARWYTGRAVENLAYQMVKYRSRAGFTHADMLRLSKRVKSTPLAVDGMDALLNWAVGKPFDPEELPEQVQGHLKALAEGNTYHSWAALVREYHLTWEMLPSEALTCAAVWEALILTPGALPFTALVRNLGRISKLLDGRNALIRRVAKRLTDPAEIKGSRIHPMNLLVALKTYSSGEGLKGSLSWVPQPRIEQALEEAFYTAFGNVKPTGKRMLLALDVSGSMGWSHVAGLPITPAEAVAALSLVTLSVEEETSVVGFAHEVRELGIRPGMRLKDAMRVTSGLPFGATNTAAAIEYALKNGLQVDAFVIMTDNDTWSGGAHVSALLQTYREKTGIDAKLVVLATTATSFSIADPADPGQLDIAGFDLSTPQALSAFVSGI